MKRVSHNKNNFIFINVLVAMIVLAVGILIGKLVLAPTSNQLATLPKPEIADGQRGELGIDKNVNESTIDQYLGRPDSVYIDLRMLDDPADYAAIGGDSKLSGIIDGFEVIPYPYLVNVTGLPEAVGKTYQGPTLYTENADGSFTPNYVQSKQILENLFPKNKNLFLICGGGGYSGMLKNMLVKLGWNPDKIYVVGGYWFYDGEHKVDIAQPDGSYAFWKVPYHAINFEDLTPIGKPNDISGTEYEKMIAKKESFILMIDNPGCTTTEKMRTMIEKFAAQLKLQYYRIMWPEAKETSLRESVKYYPSIAIIKNGEVKAALKADSDDDAKYYNNATDLEQWLKSQDVL